MEIRAAFFDMDGTLIGENSWDLIYRALDLQTSPYLEDYLEGRISYRRLVELDVSLWKSTGKKVGRALIQSLAQQVTVRNDARILAEELKRRGSVLIMVTAGLSEFAERVGKELGFDIVLSNRFVYDEKDNIAEAEVLVEPLRKGDVAENVLKKLGISRENSISVGDTEYDYSMFRATRLGFLLNREVSINDGNVIRIETLLDVLKFI
ncbi:MAG: HAD family hydrolase [Nitrososphaeria archaeon]